jgi:uncharacterized protein (DUF983 family)
MVIKSKSMSLARTKVAGKCPHCIKGAMFLEGDRYGLVEKCVNCGYSRDIPMESRRKWKRNS